VSPIKSTFMLNSGLVSLPRKLTYLLLGEAVALPSIANTLWRIWTVFTRSAITPPEVNRFGWNLGHSEYIVCRWSWQILGAIGTEARAKVLFFGQVSNARFHRLPVNQISLNLHTRRRSATWGGESFQKKLWKFPHKGSFFSKKATFLEKS